MTIAGGKQRQGGGHVDGPAESAHFSDDFDVVYSRRSCSLLVVDRGNQAIREIELHVDDCPYSYYAVGFPSGKTPITIALLCSICSRWKKNLIRLIFHRDTCSCGCCFLRLHVSSDSKKDLFNSFLPKCE